MSKAAEAFRTIGEVADDLDVKKHVLRFWESKFPAIKPMKRGGGRRYYRPEDLALLRGIRHLLHAEGYTIKGVQKLLREQGIEHVKTCAPAEIDDAPTGARRRGRKPIKVRAPATAASRQPELAFEPAVVQTPATVPDRAASDARADEAKVRGPASVPSARPHDFSVGARSATLGRVLVDLKALRAFVASPSTRDETVDVSSLHGDEAAPYMEGKSSTPSTRVAARAAGGGHRQAR